jgi:alanyl-tRNA synthetase
VETQQRPYAEAVAGGAMALFGEKYGDVVRVVTVPGVSQELCGGTHVRNTAEIARFSITSETGVAAGVRRIEAVTGRAAFDLEREREEELRKIETMVKAPSGGALRRIQALVDERRLLEKRLDDARKSGGGDQARDLLSSGSLVDGVCVIASAVSASDLNELQSLGDLVRGQMDSGVAFLSATFDNGKNTLLAVVSDKLRERGLRADEMIREVAAIAGGKGGGKPHMAQAGIPEGGNIAEALSAAADVVRRRLSAGA